MEVEYITEKLQQHNNFLFVEHVSLQVITLNDVVSKTRPQKTNERTTIQKSRQVWTAKSNK